MEISVNKIGEGFYNKLYKDTHNSVYVFGPLLLLFICTCFVLITGLTLKTLLILTIPVGLIFLSFYSTSFFIRGRIINHLVKKLRKHGDTIELETFNWYYMKPKIYRLEINNIILKKSSKEILNIKDSFEINTPDSRFQEPCFLVENFFYGDVIELFQSKKE